MQHFTFSAKQSIKKPLDQVFPFFAKAENLQKITPPWLGFKILSPLPLTMHVGTLIDYQIRFYGFPMKWKTEITVWDPPYRFVDSQLRGPYKVWIHEHRFTEENGETVIWDDVTYDFPAGPLKPLVHKLFVKNQIIEIFAYRERIISQIFSDQERVSDHHR